MDGELGTAHLRSPTPHRRAKVSVGQQDSVHQVTLNWQGTVKRVIHVCLGIDTPYLGQGREQLEMEENPS